METADPNFKINSHLISQPNSNIISQGFGVKIGQVNHQQLSSHDDVLAVEEPLEIRIEFGPIEQRVKKSISITMRTPGNDFELAT